MPNPNPDRSGLTNLYRIDADIMPLAPKGIYLRLFVEDAKALAKFPSVQRSAWMRRLIHDAIQKGDLPHA
jgi:hypothetical protein